MKNKIRVGIAGAAGYTGGELIRILINHKAVELKFAHSRTHAGKFLYQIHTDLLGETNLRFSEADFDSTDILFLCMGHGESKKFIAENSIPERINIVDLSQDFRLSDEWIYGLPEINRDHILASGKNIANPGCFATAIQLALLPLAEKNMLGDEIHISAITGSTGAGQSLSETSHFSWRSNNISIYKAFQHQHLSEIRRNITKIQPSFNSPIDFIPYRGNFTRGIMATLYTTCNWNLKEANDFFKSYYDKHPFVWISENPIDVKQVVNTNKCFLYLEKHENKLMVTSVIDNLIKGASGQAIQNMNLLFGIAETEGLNLKASAF